MIGRIRSILGFWRETIMFVAVEKFEQLTEQLDSAQVVRTMRNSMADRQGAASGADSTEAPLYRRVVDALRADIGCRPRMRCAGGSASAATPCGKRCARCAMRAWSHHGKAPGRPWCDER